MDDEAALLNDLGIDVNNSKFLIKRVKKKTKDEKFGPKMP